MKPVKILCLALVVVSLSVVSTEAQEGNRWGVGGFVSYNVPLFDFADRFDGSTDKWGVNLSYVTSNRLSMEVEYHHANFANGILETQEFTWGPVGQDFRSIDVNPDASYTMKFNSLLISGQVFLREDRSMAEGSFSPYIVMGAGFYDNLALAENIVFPAQKQSEAAAAGAPLDANGDATQPAVLMVPQEDTRTALTAAFGVGLEAFLTPTIALDVRGRYHFIVSELRPYDAWLLNKVFPLQMVDLSAGFKFYFWD